MVQEQALLHLKRMLYFSMTFSINITNSFVDIPMTAAGSAVISADQDQQNQSRDDRTADLIRVIELPADNHIIVFNYSNFNYCICPKCRMTEIVKSSFAERDFVDRGTVEQTVFWDGRAKSVAQLAAIIRSMGRHDRAGEMSGEMSGEK